MVKGLREGPPGTLPGRGPRGLLWLLRWLQREVCATALGSGVQGLIVDAGYSQALSTVLVTYSRVIQGEVQAEAADSGTFPQKSQELPTSVDNYGLYGVVKWITSVIRMTAVDNGAE